MKKNILTHSNNKTFNLFSMYDEQKQNKKSIFIIIKIF